MEANENLDVRDDYLDPERVKSQFLAKIKHDLRTPMNHIIGYSEILIEEAEGYPEGFPQNFLEDMKKIHSVGKQLLSFINDIFDPLKATELGFAAIRHNLRCHLNSIMGYSGILLENSNTDQPDVFVPDLRKVHAASECLLGLIDEIPNIWESGAQTVRPIAPSALAPTQTAEVKADQGRCSILVVDDNEDNRDMLSRRLENLGYWVQRAEHGLEVLDKLAKESFDLVLLDVMMPVLDGYQTLERIKADPNLRHIPVLMISALDDIAVVSRCIGVGAEDYLLKPFDPVILKARVSAALERKRLRQAEQQLLDYLHKELLIAGRIQANMLPSKFPLFPQCKAFDVFASMIPAKQVGGDFYDVFFIDRHEVFIMVGDVSGKGISAALFMVQSMNHLRMQALRALPPHRILYEANNLLCANNEVGMFVTLFCGILDTETGRFVYSNGGHNPPITDALTGKFDFMPVPQGSVVGFTEGAKYKSASLQLKPGDTVFVYTDGVTEAEDRQKNLFSNERLLNFMAVSGGGSAREIVEHVRTEIDTFSEGVDQSDDITMLTLRYLGGKDT